LEQLKRKPVHAVDLGAGTGQATRPLTEYFERVSAVEPDPRLAEKAGLSTNAEIFVKAAEKADFPPGSVDAVITATAFHWMDQPLICRKVANWLGDGGVFFPFAYDAFDVEGEAGELYRSEFEKWAPYRDRRLLECYDYERALKSSGVFQTVDPFAFKSRREISTAAAAGLISTFSFARDYARDNGGDAYFQSLGEKLKMLGETVSFVVPVIGAAAVKA
jgi:SAM-dependent methyltransferase